LGQVEKPVQKETFVNTRSMKKRLTFVICVAIAAGNAVPAGAENAPARPAAKAAERPHGAWRHHGSYTQTTQTQRTANGHTSYTVRTDAQGRTATRDATVVNDKDSGTSTKDVTFTGKDGQMRTADTTTQKTADGHTSSTTLTDAQGRTSTREATVVNDKGAGTRDRDVTYIGPNGRVRTVDDDLTRTADGYERSTLVTGPNGATTTRNVDASHDADTHTTTKTVTVDHTPAP
jgi:hypothetical protein